MLAAISRRKAKPSYFLESRRGFSLDDPWSNSDGLLGGTSFIELSPRSSQTADVNYFTTSSF